MSELDCEESWVPKNWCFWTVVLEKTLESPLDYKEIQLFDPTGNQSWLLIGRTDAEAEASVLWPPDAKYWLTGKTLSWERLKAGKEGDERGWDDWMASLTQWKWVWASFRCCWWTGKPGMLQSMIHRVRHDWINEVDYTWYDCISVSPTCPLLLSFHPLLWRLFSSCFLALFRGNYPIFRYILYLREMVLSTILNLPQWLLLNYQI